MRPWGYEAAQTEEPIPAPNTTVGTGELLYLSPEELNGSYNSIPQNTIMLDLNQLNFLVAQLENDATSPQDRLAEELAGLCGVLNAIEADLQATAPDQETTERGTICGSARFTTLARSIWSDLPYKLLPRIKRQLRYRI